MAKLLNKYVNFKQWYTEWEGNTAAVGDSPEGDSFMQNSQGWPVRSKNFGPGTPEPSDLSKAERMYGIKRQLLLKKMKSSNK